MLYHLVFGKLTHLKNLELCECALMYEPEFLINIHEIIPSLETLIMETDLPLIMPMDINYLIEVLDSIGNVKNLKIYCCLGFQYRLNNKEFRRHVQNDLNEDQTRVVFERAMEVINKKFPIDSTFLKIVDNEYGWRIKKEGGKAPVMIKKPYKCTFIDDSVGPGPKLTCMKLFTEKAKLEEHMKHRYGHCYPDYLL